MLEQQRKPLKLKLFLEQNDIPKSTWYLWESQGKTPETWKMGKHRMLWDTVAQDWLNTMAGAE